MDDDVDGVDTEDWRDAADLAANLWPDGGTLGTAWDHDAAAEAATAGAVGAEGDLGDGVDREGDLDAAADEAADLGADEVNRPCAAAALDAGGTWWGGSTGKPLKMALMAFSTFKKCSKSKSMVMSRMKGAVL